MMRELKDNYFTFCLCLEWGCSPNPYDEGTERFIGLNGELEVWMAAAQIPMMRELKVGSTEDNV